MTLTSTASGSHWNLWREANRRARTRTNNKHNPQIASPRAIEPGPHWWEASSLTTAPYTCSHDHSFNNYQFPCNGGCFVSLIELKWFSLCFHFYSEYSLSQWEAISDACSLSCCLKEGVAAQNRLCSTTERSVPCVGVLLTRQFNCSDICACKVGMMC